MHERVDDAEVDRLRTDDVGRFRPRRREDPVVGGGVELLQTAHAVQRHDGEATIAHDHSRRLELVCTKDARHAPTLAERSWRCWRPLTATVQSAVAKLPKGC